MAENNENIVEDIRWDLIGAIGAYDDTEFGYRIVGNEFFALEYDVAGNEVAQYKVTITAEKVKGD